MIEALEEQLLDFMKSERDQRLGVTFQMAGCVCGSTCLENEYVEFQGKVMAIESRGAYFRVVKGGPFSKDSSQLLSVLHELAGLFRHV